MGGGLLNGLQSANSDRSYPAADSDCRTCLISLAFNAICSREIAAPLDKPWGQTISYVRCPDGTLVELCTPIK